MNDPVKPQGVRQPLIVDSDIVFLEQLKNDPKAAALPPLLAGNGKQAQLLLSNTALSFSGVYVNSNLSDGYSLSVVRFAHRYRPATPIFSLVNPKASPYSSQELHQLGIQYSIQKPTNYATIIELHMPSTVTFDSTAALEQTKKNTDNTDEEVNAKDVQFIPIIASNFVSGTTSFFDVYVRLSSGRYVKILKGGDSFTYDRVSNYLNKGVTHFYIRKEVQELYLGFCDKIATAAKKSTKISSRVQVIQTLNHGQEVMNYLKTSEINPSYIQHAANFVTNVNDLVKRMGDEQKNPYLDDFLKNVAAYEHGAGTAVIAAVLAKALKIQSDDLVRLIGLASLFHDIGLSKLPPEAQDEDALEMSPENQALYFTHPIIGANIIKTFRDIHPTTVQAVLQHHERRNNSGFPNKLGVGSINKVAEIVGMSEEFNRLIAKTKVDSKFDPLAEMAKKITANFTFQVAEAFRSAFLEKKDAPG